MTSHQIVEHLAQELSVQPEQVLRTLEMLDAGLRAPFIGRVRRAQTGGLTEGLVRKLDHMRNEFAELDRRRATILRMLETGEGGRKADEASLERVRRCTDRFELEDLFLPHRRPEPEVQLALDRGLGRLADELVAAVAREPDAREQEPQDADDEAAEPENAAPQARADDSEQRASDTPAEASGEPALATAGEGEGDGALASSEASEAEAQASMESLHAAAAAAHEAVASGETHDAEIAEHAPSDSPGANDGADSSERHAATDTGESREPSISVSVKPDGLSAAEDALLHATIEVTPALARVCAAYVSPDRGLHSEAEALAGAMRILSDRLGRDARLRGTIRKLLRKQGVLAVRATVEESRLGRHKPLLKLKQPLRQLQGHRLLAIRQAQKERAVMTVITLDRKIAWPKVRAALGTRTNPEYSGVLDAVALRTLEHRLLPLIEADVRLELKERADDEALRFLSQHLRQVLLTSPLGRYPVAGVDVSAKGDWTIAFVDAKGAVHGEQARIELKTEAGDKDDATLGAELKAAFDAHSERAPVAIGIGHGKLSRSALSKLRAVCRAAGLTQVVHVVNDSGIASYASSELARSELGELAVPQRVAVALARRLQDPLDEILKVDPRHLGLGAEQGLVSKANLKRMFDDTLESTAALVGCDLNQASATFLAQLPGIDAEVAQRILTRRAERPFEHRDELRGEGLLTEVQWTNAIAALRVHGEQEPLDRTSLHPEQYDAARRVLEASGGSVAENLGRPGVTKGLRRDAFGIEDHTWRDLMRELWQPGRDPRNSLFPPKLLSHDTDRVTLTKDRAVDGVITNVASFGAFVDIGLEHDGLIHVSEISDRYVRDARELISIGETVRLRLVDGSAQRVALSLKNVPEPERPPRPERAPRGRFEGGGEGREGGARFGRRERFEEPRAPVRAAVSRRDGLMSGGKKRGGPRKGGQRPDDRRRGPREDEATAEDLRALKSSSGYNPFASFFKGPKSGS